jgi:RNA polymerase sigma factor (sigma-70 family)
MKAVDNYDPKKGKFSTYSAWYIKQYITRAIGDTERTIRVPIHMIQKIYELEKIKKRILKEENRRPSTKELAVKMELSVNQVRGIIKASEEVTSLDKQRAGEDGDLTLLDIIADEGPTPDEIAESKVFIEQFIDEFKHKLKPIELETIIMYYGLNEEGKCYTFKQIAEIHKVHTSRVGQIRDEALNKVRKSLFIRELREEIDIETNYYPITDYTRVGSSGALPSSPVERLAMKREALLEKKLKYLKED